MNELNDNDHDDNDRENSGKTASTPLTGSTRQKTLRSRGLLLDQTLDKKLGQYLNKYITPDNTSYTKFLFLNE